MKKQFFLFLLLCALLQMCTSGNLHAKQGKAFIDSLLKELPKQKEDTLKVLMLNYISFAYSNVSMDEGIKFGSQGLELAEKLHWKKGQAHSYNSLGVNYQHKSDYAKAMEYYSKSHKICNELGDKQLITMVFANMAIVYKLQGNYEKALAYNDTSLKIAEELGDKRSVSQSYGNMGSVYRLQSNYPKALEYYFKQVKIAEEIGDKTGLAIATGNIGNVYFFQHDYNTAIQYYQKQLKMDEELGQNEGVARVSGNIGSLYTEQKEYDKALPYLFIALGKYDTLGSKSGMADILDNIGSVYALQKKLLLSMLYLQRSLKLCEEVGNKRGIAQNTFNIGSNYFSIATDTDKASIQMVNAGLPGVVIPAGKQARLQKATENMERGLEISKSIPDLDIMQNCYSALINVYKLKGDFKKALESSDNYHAIKDSVFSKDNHDQIVKLGAKNEYDHQRLADSLKTERKEKVTQLQLQRQRGIIYGGIAGLLGVLLLAFFIYRSYDNQKKANVIIQAEKENAEAQRIRAERSERFKQEFLANMSHEIRTPMNAVNGMTDLLMAKNPRPDQLNYLKVISKSSDILLHIINDILDMSKIEVGKMELETIDFQLADTIEQVKDTLSFRAEEKGLQLITTIDDKVNEVLIGDPFRLNQILINLGGNAIKFTNKGSVEIKAKCISEEAGKQQLRFSVTDTGMGIPADKLQDLFESFKQVNRSDTRKFGGTGLGLSISKQLVELQGGSITVESKEGNGTVFSFVLTYAAGSKEKLDDRIRHDEQADGRMLNGLRILLADDNEYNRLVVSETLHLKAEVLIDEAVNGLKAVQLLEKNDYDIVLMDVQMPEMNGFEATEYIRTKLPASKNKIPIVALTASMLKLDIDMCYQHGMNTFVPKPFKSWQLIRAIAEQTGRTAADITEPRKEELTVNNIPVPVTEGGVTDLAYLTKFCEGDEERIKKYIGIYLAAVPGFEDKVKEAMDLKDALEIAALMHTFKPKWMMMGMKRTIALGQKIELLCTETGYDEKITDHLVTLIKQNEQSVKELENIS